MNLRVARLGTLRAFLDTQRRKIAGLIVIGTGPEFLASMAFIVAIKTENMSMGFLLSMLIRGGRKHIGGFADCGINYRT